MASSAIRNHTWLPGSSWAPNQKVPFSSRVGSRSVRVLAPPGQSSRRSLDDDRQLAAGHGSRTRLDFLKPLRYRGEFRLGQKLGEFILDHDLGECFFAPCDVVLSDTDVVQPDLLFVSREREHLLSGGENVRGAPDLVVEILSAATAGRDRGYKRALYGRHGVVEYWLVDPTAETVWIHRQRAGVLAVTHTFGREQTLRSPLLAGLELD